MLKLDAAADVHHERLSVLRQAFEDAYQIPQSFVNLRRIRNRLFREIAENLKLIRDSSSATLCSSARRFNA